MPPRAVRVAVAAVESSKKFVAPPKALSAVPPVTVIAALPAEDAPKKNVEPEANVATRAFANVENVVDLEFAEGGGQVLLGKGRGGVRLDVQPHR